MRYLNTIILSFMMSLAAATAVPASNTSQQLAQSTNTISAIIVEGANRIDPETIQTYLMIQPGDSFDASRVDRSLKAMFATGLFADISFSQEGQNLIIKVVENPIINQIAFEGNDAVEDDRIEPEVSLRPRVIYTRTKVQNDVQRILTLYRRLGRFAVTVEPKVIQLPQNRVDLVFEINEGEPTDISNIRFVGNTEFDDDDLRSIVQTKESRWYRFLSSDDVYDPDRLTLDKELLRQFYLKEGYADFRVMSAVAELTPDRKKFFITLTVDEGERYTFGELLVNARLRDLDGDVLLAKIEPKAGDWYSSEALEDTLDMLSDEVGSLGYAFVDVRPKINRNRADRKIDIVFEINEGPRVFVERIDITGNVRTVDKVIRREMGLAEGDAFSSSNLRDSRTHIQELDFFEAVNVERLPGSAPDKTTIKVDVEEKSTGSLSLGVGYSTDTGALGDVGIRERNFMGRGQDLSLNMRIAMQGSEVDLSFTEPYFLDRKLSAGFDLFRKTEDKKDQSSYESKEVGGSLRLGYTLADHLYQNWKYLFSVRDVTNVNSDASIFVLAQAGEETTSEVTHSIRYDRRDSRLNPREGYYVSLSNSLAGLGGTSNYLQNTVRGGYYHPFTDTVVLSVGGKVGSIIGLGEDVGLLDRFYIGGSDLRGFATSGVGPRDTSTGDALGGEWMYVGSIELKVPVGLPEELGVGGRIFTDFGSTGKLSDSSSVVEDTKSLRASVGAGITWLSPLGPMGVDFGVPVKKETFDITETVRVNFGTRF
ncbi:MAG: outer membrane protein assembly factor BamA [Rhodospirillales bacterium]|jgi:outer membrane protein insertion porin family|nr:outer membrane protein assembly factor BamA [Rhodospirillales bacterium]